MDTSGVLLLALTKEAHQELQAQFKHRTVRKRYIALLEGRITPPKGRIELPLRPTSTTVPDRRSIPCTKTGDHGVRSVGIPERPHPHRPLPADRPHAPVARPCGPSIGDSMLRSRGDRLYGTAGRRLFLHAERIEIPPSGDRRSDSDRKTGGFLMSQEKADASRSPLFPHLTLFITRPELFHRLIICYL